MIMCLMESDGDHFLMYYLMKDNTVEEFNESWADPHDIDSL